MVAPLNTLQQAQLVLNQGGVVLHPTETCYGFACDATNMAAVRNLYELKKMPLEKPSSLMVASFERASGYGEFSHLAQALAEKYWPGPLTLIVPRKNLPEFLNPGATTVGLRVPSHAWTLELLKMCNFPLITTSANVSGQPQAYEVAEVLRQLGDVRPGFVVDMGKIPSEKPSTIVEVTGELVKIVREGPIASAEILAFCASFSRL
ncbi:MAG: L-threonylcarbamoyladenylate synthase [Patescibacteria group bacterium]